MNNFSDFILDPLLLQSLKEMGHETPTSIQEKSIPLLLEGRDLIGIAQTGTGKTGAFVLPLLQRFITVGKQSEPRYPRALILVPTRELCAQISESIKLYSRHLPVSSCAIYGGETQQEQIQSLKAGVDIVVATPGRLLDLMTQKQIFLEQVEYFVLDEADRMLDMGFMDDLDKIIAYLPQKKQSVFFSATMPRAITDFAKKLLRHPQRVEVTASSTISKLIKQKVIFSKEQDKFQLLKKILKTEEVDLAIVFTRTKTMSDQVVEYLKQNRMAARAIHGDKEQSERVRALDHFKEGVIKVLVATDLASRGLDIENISHVINFELPREAETYVHRIGRTARAGKEGEAISFCDETEMGLLEKIQHLIKERLPSEKFVGKPEVFKLSAAKKVTAPTPGKSQEKSAYVDHSKRQRPLQEGEKKRVHPGFKKSGKKRR